MEYVHEIIHFEDNNALKLFLHKANGAARHWHESMELLWVVDGTCQITISNESYHLREDDILLVNANTPHELAAIQGDYVLLALQSKPSLLKAVIPDENTTFRLNSSLYREQAPFRTIKTLMAELVRYQGDGDAYARLMVHSILCRLYYELYTHFAAGYSNVARANTKHIDKLQDILEFVQRNYSASVSLKQIAEDNFFSPPYLSRLFERTMGVTFKKYVDSIRFTHALRDLTTTGKPIEAVALDNGFPNARAFTAQCRERYGCLPSEYRARHASGLTPRLDDPYSVNYMEFEQTDYLAKISRYLQAASVQGAAEERPSALKRTNGPIPVERQGEALRHTFRTFTSVGQARNLLNANVQSMLSGLQKQVGFQYIKFHGILDDAMMVCLKMPDGKLQYNFRYVDTALDFLRSIGLRPLIQLSFMPSALAADPGHTIFQSASIISMPKERAAWCALVTALTKHLVERYGRSEVAQWLFSVWNEPESPPSMFGLCSPEAFYALYRDTYSSVKAVDTSLRFGAPSLMSDTVLKSAWFTGFVTYCKQMHCYPDFLNIHFYPLALQSVAEPGVQWSTRLTLSKDADALGTCIRAIKTRLSALCFDGVPLYLTEWNSTTSHRDLLNDTAFKGAYVAKNILENYDGLDSFGYWSLTDWIEELPPAPQPFHGGLGLYTATGIPKPPCHVLALLAQLGDHLLERGEGYFVTRHEQGLRILLYHYVHYSELYASGETFDMTYLDRYTPFGTPRDWEVELQFSGLPDGIYTATFHTVGRSSGSCFDAWKHSGGLPIDDCAELELLRAASSPGMEKRSLIAENGLLPLQVRLAPHDVCLISIPL